MCTTKKSESEKELQQRSCCRFLKYLENQRINSVGQVKTEIVRLKSLFYRNIKIYRNKESKLATGEKGRRLCSIVVEEETELKNLLAEYKEKRGQELAKAEKS